MAKRYDENIDYMELINQAKQNGDNAAAAEYEQLRNEKINGMGITEYNPTYEYNSSDYTSNDSYDPTSPDNVLKQEFEKNKNDWANADEATKKQLHDRNETIGKHFGWVYDPASGVWDTSSKQPQNNKPSNPGFNGSFTNQINDIINNLTSYKDFKYDALNDPLYKQYAEQYQKEGKRATANTLGDVAANTGGLASSYATTAATQAGDYYASKQADKIPELQQLAYNKYLKDIDSQMQKLGLLQGANNEEYNRYRDTINDKRYESEMAAQAEKNKYNNQKDVGLWLYENFGDTSGLGGIGLNGAQQEGAGKTWLENYKKQQELERMELEAKQYKAASKSSGGGGSKSAKYKEPKQEKPTLTATQVDKAIENGNFSPNVKSAYEYYYGEEIPNSKIDTSDYNGLMESIDAGEITYDDLMASENNREITQEWINRFGQANYKKILARLIEARDFESEGY